ncbi:hypothetical protein ACIA8B_28635 [Micromonospora chalcea]|uniref:hypothetical protein n=1 Tax=Micromonospora sp. TSRI0369 TaxID=1703936 RepID=UPI001160FE9E|nr:hypothetical protein [Micromonospora sp. TSRI0369]
MEAFESMVALALEDEQLVVSGAIKFPVSRQTPSGLQTHGYEVDLVGARSDRLVLASVKSAFGSRGVVADHVLGSTDNIRARKLYALLNDLVVREAVILAAAKSYGYSPSQVYLRFYVGRFAGPTRGIDEERIRGWCANQVVGGGLIEVYGVRDVVDRVVRLAANKQYRDHAVLATLKALSAAGKLNLKLPEGSTDDPAGRQAPYSIPPE